MNRRLNLLMLLSLFSLPALSQWNSKDSVNLRRLLEGDGEVKLNRDVLKEIDFGTHAPKLMPGQDKSAVDVDMTLPNVLPEKKRPKLTLMPYNAETKFNYDPIYKRKIEIDADTWRGNPFWHLTKYFRYTNWAKGPTDPAVRRSREEIEATGVSYNMMGERANGVLVGTLGSEGVTGSGGSGIVFSGDLLKYTTREFWDKAGRARRARTLEVLRHYGDSTTIQIREEIKQPPAR